MIKKITLGQCEVVANIIRMSFVKQVEILNITEKDYPNYVAFETPQRVENALNIGEEIFLLYVDEKPIGTIRFNIGENGVGYINRLAALPAYRKNHYGEKLMSFAESELKNQGVNLIEISIVKQFEKLEAFYISLGYKFKEDKTFPFLPFEVRYMEKYI